MKFSAAETAACKRLAEIAWEEDLGPGADFLTDLTSRTILPPNLDGRAVFVAREPGIVAGLPAVEVVLSSANTPLLRFEPFVEDGSSVVAGQELACVSGIMEFILTAERTALNFMQRLSGVATQTRRFVDAVAGIPCKILDTRKTTPGWRLLEKYAVRMGGGHNHRMGLYDGILIKDNHLAALGGGKEAFRRVFHSLTHRPYTIPIPVEIEVDRLDQLEAALACLPDVVLLDNMTLEQMREAVRIRDQKAPSILLEASGGVNLSNGTCHCGNPCRSHQRGSAHPFAPSTGYCPGLWRGLTCVQRLLS